MTEESFDAFILRLKGHAADLSRRAETTRTLVKTLEAHPEVYLVWKQLREGCI